MQAIWIEKRVKACERYGKPRLERSHTLKWVVLQMMVVPAVIGVLAGSPRCSPLVSDTFLLLEKETELRHPRTLLKMLGWMPQVGRREWESSDRRRPERHLV